MAVKENKLSAMKCLLKHGKCDLEIKNNDGQRVQDIAREKGLSSFTSIFTEHVS